MRTLPMRASLTILSCSFMAITAMAAHAQNAQSVRLGEAALTFPPARFARRCRWRESLM